MPRPNLNLLNIAHHVGIEPDPWQFDVLTNPRPRLLLNCSRQSGKSTVVALLALVHAMTDPYAKILLLSRSQRQAGELFRTLRGFYKKLGNRGCAKETATELLLGNEARVLCLPCRE